MATLQCTITKVTVGDRDLEVVSKVSTRAARTVARVTKGVMTRPTHNRIMCKERKKRMRKCGEDSSELRLWHCLRSPTETGTNAHAASQCFSACVCCFPLLF